MSKICFWVAGVLGMLLVLAHVFLGGAAVVPAWLGTPELPEKAAWLAYFSWHVGTVAMGLCALAYMYAAIKPGQKGLAIFVNLMLTGFAAVGLTMALRGSDVLWTTPAPYAFWIITGFGWAGVFTAKA